MAFWDPRAERSVVDVRPGGPGNPWQILDIDGEMAAPSGGGRPVDSKWGRGARAGQRYLGGRFTGNPERVTAQLMTRLKSETFLSELTKMRCFFDARVRQRCGDVYSKTDYTMALALFDAAVTSRTYSGQIANNATSQDEDIMNQYDASGGLEIRYKKLRHDNISKSVSDTAFNKIRSVGAETCNDNCGTLNAGDKDFIAVTDQDNTPGYASNAAPLFYWTTDGGQRWSSVYIDVAPTTNALDVVLAGENIVVAIPTLGCVYARFQDIKDLVSNPWTLSTGFSNSNGPNALDYRDGKILAVGNGGRVWKSEDGGISFTSVDDGATTSEDLNSVALADRSLGWIGGDNGVLLRYSASGDDTGIVTRVIVQDSTTTLSANINTVAAPENRQREVYVGTAGGEIWRTRAGLSTRPLFENMSFDKNGSGSIDDLQFVGPFGDVLFVVQTDANSDSRVLRDLSGGALGSDVEVIGSFDFPGNNGINSIAPANQNMALTAGEVANSVAFLGAVVAE